jgi:hypothetical protein
MSGFLFGLAFAEAIYFCTFQNRGYHFGLLSHSLSKRTIQCGRSRCSHLVLMRTSDHALLVTLRHKLQSLPHTSACRALRSLLAFVRSETLRRPRISKTSKSNTRRHSC